MTVDGGTPAGAAPVLDTAPYRDVVVRVDLDDLRSAAVFAGLLLVGLLLASVGPETSAGLATDARSAASRVPWQILLGLTVLAQAAVLVAALVAPVVLLVRRRPRLLLTGGLAIVLALVASAAFHAALAARFPTPEVAVVRPELEDLGPGLGVVAALAAVLATLRPSRTWARAWWSLLAVLVVLDVLLQVSGPLDAVASVGVGGLVGVLVTLTCGRTVRVLTTHGVRETLSGAGLEVTEVREAATAGTPRVVHAWAADGGTLSVTVVDRRSWRRERMSRTYRRARLRTGVDEEGSTSPVRALALEAALLQLAAAGGARVPTVRALARAPEGEALLACDQIEGRRLDDVPAAAVTDGVLHAAWTQVASLRGARVAHRELSLRHLVLADDGGIGVTDLGHGEPGAPEQVLAGDVAELLVATATLVGPERAAAAAHAVLGPTPVAAAVARMVPAALTPATRALLQDGETGLDDVVAVTCRVAGVAEPVFEKIERFRPRTLVAGAMIVVAVYFLAPQLADLPGLLETVREVDTAWLVPVVLASAATYLGAALGLAGGTPGRVPVGEASAVAVAASFVATFAPPGVGQVGLNIRYLQRRGFPTPVAVSASAAKEAAVLTVHLTLLAAFALWAGTTDALARELEGLPSGRTLGLWGLGAAVVVGAVFVVPAARRLVRERVVPAVRSSVTAMHEVITSPAKMIALLGGVVLLPLGYAVCLYFSVRAFDGDVGFVAVALVSLTAGTVATAAPVPGGVGAVEAVLVASLTGIGLDGATALAAVVLYRLATFWLPIAPGAVAFRVLTRREVL
ncbi:lysylphosphatidylglycerol synthase transmembrane domain-containing protein [Isoptericola aurantiacus]|uniref:lysylphosphatidylglycerol synthase transmembrane domain-containing protein n=1 Tax=Isoptericola aurantiacus TaxID=3377839 RepID=UPI00383B1EF4